MSLCYKTVYDLFDSFCNESPNHVILEDENQKFNVKELFGTICNTANYLTQKGIKKGDIVPILCKKDVETIIYFYACQLIGCVAFMLDAHDDIKKIEEEYGFDIKYSVFDNRDITKTDIIPELLFDKDIDSMDTTIAISTSGSTGDRKIVKLSQYAFINNSVDSKDAGWYDEDDNLLLFLPLNHVYGIATITSALVFRFKVVVAKSTDINYLLECIEKYRITRFSSVPSIFLKMAELHNQYDVSTLKCAYIGGAPCSEKEYFKIEKELGIKLIPVYGMSECVGMSTGYYKFDSKILCNSVGKPYPLNDVKIAEDGEVLVKSPSICNGYFKGEVPVKDGYLLTGDIGEFDEEGYLHIVGRKKEIIIRNGLNISINAISRKISDAELFKDFVVVGISDSEVGEKPAVAYVPKDNKNIDQVVDELKKYLNKQEMPGKVLCLDSIPLLENGKVDKKSVKNLFI